MSTQESNSNRRRPERAPWLGHNAWWIQIASCAVLFVLIAFSVMTKLATGHVPAPTQPVWEIRWSDFTVLVPLLVFSFWLRHRQRKHDRQLCIRCAEAVPLDTEAAVIRHRRALWIMHEPRTLRGNLILAGVLIAALLGWAIGLIVSMPWHLSSVIVFVIIGFGGIVAPWSEEWHRRLQPWCPQCRDDNGWDDGDVIPEPSPDPQIKADR